LSTQNVFTALISVLCDVHPYTLPWHLSMTTLRCCLGGFWAPFATFVSISIGYAIVAGSLVAFVEPLAAGSGIPEIKTYLNGIHIKGLLTASITHLSVSHVVCVSLSMSHLSVQQCQLRQYQLIAPRLCSIMRVVCLSLCV